jgi:hypothetical protein
MSTRAEILRDHVKMFQTVVREREDNLRDTRARLRDAIVALKHHEALETRLEERDSQEEAEEVPKCLPKRFLAGSIYTDVDFEDATDRINWLLDRAGSETKRLKELELLVNRRIYP